MITVPGNDNLAMVTYWADRRYGPCEDGCQAPAQYVVNVETVFGSTFDHYVCALCAASRASQGETIIPANDEAVNQ
jgi:hypothetical protein